MVESSIFWESEKKNVKDPNWRVFEYDDGAVEFVCVKCKKSIWQGRKVVSETFSGTKIAAHFSKNVNKYAVFISERHGSPPKEIEIFPPNIDCSEPLLWALLAGWNHAKQGPPIERDIPPEEFLTVTESIEKSPENSFNTPPPNRTFEDHINVGIGLLTPGQPPLTLTG